MAEVIKMPKMSDTMTEGVISTWLKKEGDVIVSGDVLAEVETDKATMELESYEDGILLHIGVPEKATVAVDAIIAIIGAKGEDIQSLISDSSQSVSGPATVPTGDTEPAKVDTMDASSIKASVLRMPKMSDTMTEGVIAQWLMKVGDQVSSGDILAEVETDKATMELESYDDGTLLYTAASAGSAVEVDGIIAIIGEENADYEALLQSENKVAPKAETVVAAAVPATVEASIVSAAPVPASDGRVLASPLAKKMAQDKGIDLSTLLGSGDGGRIVKKDVETFEPAIAKTAQVAGTHENYVKPVVIGAEASEDIALTQMRKVIASRLSASKFSAPHFYLTMEINMDKAMSARVSMNEVSPVKISFNDIVLKAVASAIRQNPDVNVSWLEDKMQKHQHIHIGVAVAIPDGLVVPVVKFADNKSLAHISSEVKDLAQRAVAKKLAPEEFTGNTFSISNLGMFGVEEFTAIINPPNACILAIGGIKEAVIVKNGIMNPGHTMKVTLSCDHRAVDGAVGAAFLKSLKGLLEDPVRILI
ncbi:MAG: 2-oxo acid dehydrogenase subunit E2 [Cyclobacteriaceae bacterium]|nr:2-oxo acid dehydrogenase subunit E2 [Cyclobacteriaceae bacterium]